MIRVGWVRRSALNARLAGARGLPWALLSILAAVVLRTLLDPWVVGVPFLTFFPAVQIASLMLGWRWGAFVLVASALTANFMFQAPFMAFTFRPNELAASAAFLLTGALMIWASDTLRRAIIELAAAARRERELNLELAHRVNNSLAVVQGLAQQTLRVHADSSSFYEAFSGRLLALSEANKILMSGSTEFSQLPELAEAATKPFTGRHQMTLSGPRCAIPAISSVPLVLALHELSTNATKYGALSVPTGCVQLSWSVEGAQCRFVWREIDGPAVLPPHRRGLGTRLLARQAGIDEVKLAFDPLGVVCEITLNGASLVAGQAEQAQQPVMREASALT